MNTHLKPRVIACIIATTGARAFVPESLLVRDDA